MGLWRMGVSRQANVYAFVQACNNVGPLNDYSISLTPLESTLTSVFDLWYPIISSTMILAINSYKLLFFVAAVVFYYCCEYDLRLAVH